MERIEGEVLGALLPRMRPEERERELDRLCRLLFRLHALPAEDFHDLVPGIDPSDPLEPIRRVRRSLTRAITEHHLVGFRPVLDWLASREASLACPRLSAAHLDFHPYNVIRSPDDRLTVLDWTAFTVTDARLDLAWTLVLAHSFEGERLRTRILRGYEAAAGAKVCEIDAFEVTACVRRLVDLLVSLESGPEARGMRPDAVSAMRKMEGAHRRVYELLRDRTGIGVPEAEKMLAELRRARG
jgi:aminoglycoside phosphotransferase (APT) family kinase protein